MQKTTFFLCLFFSIRIVSAQTKNEDYNNLLWRISGNGLTKPSYVFGTMHISDKRVFHFTDSLYKSLEQSDGFAAELDIENLFAEYFDGFINAEKKGSGKLIVDSIDEKTLAAYRNDLEKKFKKSINEITVAEINDAADEWMKEAFKKGEMNTIMDAWLFDIARRQGKWVGGIEDFADQDGLKDSITMVEKFETIRNLESVDSMMNRMIETYVKQELHLIDRTEGVWQGSRDALLVRRNIKMARRMDSLVRIRSVFFAVGAAHIPGEDGVIHLLRQRGFTVTPIHSDKRIAPENYTFKQIDMPWYEIDTVDGLYKLKMPGKPLKQSIDGENSPAVTLYFDMGHLRGYFTIALPIPETTTWPANAADSTLTKLAQYYKETMTVTEKDILVNGIKGKEISGTDKEGAEIRVQIFAVPSLVVINAISGYNKNNLYGNEPEKFFTSFKINSNPKSVVAKSSKTWQRYNFDKYGFSVELPGKYKEEKVDREDEAWDQKYYSTMDFASSTFLGVIISSVKKGYYSNSDSAFFEERVASMATNMNAELIFKHHFMLDGYPAFKGDAKTSGDKNKHAIRILMINKGPRRYLLFTTFDQHNQSESSAQFFESFKFLPETNTTWAKKFAPDQTFSIWSPAAVTSGEKETNGVKYLIHDTVSNVQVFVDKETFPPYLWADNDTTLLKDKVRTYIGNSDSVIFNKQFTAGKLKGVDLLVKIKGTHSLKKLRTMLNGDTVYTVYTFLPSQYLETENYRRLFDDFKINFETTISSLYQRKPEQLLLALQTKDSAEFEKAKGIFNYISFIRDDVPLLQKSLLRPHYDFDSTYYYNINKSISEWIEILDSNHTSIAFARENYPKLTGDKELMKPFLLGLLSFIKTNESYSLLKELIVKSPPKISKEYYWRNGLYDSLVLTKILFPEILSLAGDAGAYDFLNDLTLRMLDSGFVNVETIKKYKEGYIKNGKRILSLPAGQRELNYYYYSSLAKLLGKISDPDGNDILKKLGDINVNSIKLDVVLAQASNKQQPEMKNIKVLAVSDEYRQRLYNGLVEAKRIDLFPTEFLNQRSLAQSTIFEYASEDDYPPDEIEFVGEKAESFMGKKQKFYLFKLCFKNEDKDNNECFFAAAGPYSLDRKNLESNQEVTEIHWEHEFDDKSIGEWLKNMIRRTEDWIKQRDTRSN